MTRVAALVGPTAVGKTALSLEVARSLDAEVVSIDSMQIYRGMDIGTDKVSAAIRAAVTHHLVDLKDPSESLTVAEFQALARAAIEDVSARGRLPLLVGGSGLYFRAVVDDLNFPPHAPDVRRSLAEEAEVVGAEALHARLAAIDPVAAARIEPGNERRTIRALEVIEITGRRFSENDGWERYESIYELAAAGLTRPRDELYRRIEQRVDEMFERGLLQEVESLGRHGLGVTARHALGYRQVLEGGERQSVRDAIVRTTKRFARRQESWLRADPRIEWFDADERDAAARVVA